VKEQFDRARSTGMPAPATLKTILVRQSTRERFGTLQDGLFYKVKKTALQQ
jgi:ABC-type amino acid transport system permease subunit